MISITGFLEHHLFTCSVKGLLGFDCPGCGMQRALIALLKGNLMESLDLNPSLIPFLLTVFYTIAHLCFGFKNGAKLIVIFFSLTASLMLANFIIKLFLHV